MIRHITQIFILMVIYNNAKQAYFKKYRNNLKAYQYNAKYDFQHFLFLPEQPPAFFTAFFFFDLLEHFVNFFITKSLIFFQIFSFTVNIVIHELVCSVSVLLKGSEKVFEVEYILIRHILI